MKFAVGFADPLWVHPKQPGQCLSEIFDALTIAPATHFLFAEYHPQPPWVASPATPPLQPLLPSPPRILGSPPRNSAPSWRSTDDAVFDQAQRPVARPPSGTQEPSLTALPPALAPASLFRFAGEHPRPLQRHGGVFPHSGQRANRGLCAPAPRHRQRPLRHTCHRGRDPQGKPQPQAIWESQPVCGGEAPAAPAGRSTELRSRGEGAFPSPHAIGPFAPPHATCSSPRSGRTTAALVCSPLISLK
jgi:hypothetical protein